MLILYSAYGTLLGAQTTSATKKANDVELIDEIESLRQELKEVKQLLQKQGQMLPQGASRVPTLPQAVDGEVVLPFVPSQSIGKAGIKYVVVEFSDLQCPFCAYFDKHSFQKFKESQVDTDKVRFMSVDFPLESHPDAAKMSLATICAGDQNKYWEMRTSLVTAANLAEPSLLDNLATSMKLNVSNFNDCVSSTKRLSELKLQASKAREMGVSGTPTFLVGVVEDGKVRGHLVVGALGADEFGTRIDQLLATYHGGSDAGKTSEAK